MSAERFSLFFVAEALNIVKTKLKHTIAELADSVLANSELFLVDVEIKGASETVVWIYVDAEDRGVNMDECAELSNELGFLIEAHDLFRKKYRLNVSSPGLSRPLTDRRQFPKNKGRKTRVKYKDNGEYLKTEGILRDVGSGEIVIETEDGTRKSILFDQLVETRIIPNI